MARRLARSWFARDAPSLAADLLGKVLSVTDADGVEVAGRIIETEAYRSDDPASHSYRGPTPRTAVMFGPPAHLYVYLSYGIHRCANVVAGVDGDGQAVLLRALEPIRGVDVMRERRHGRPDRQLVDGPGKLCAALGIGLDDNAVDLLAATSRIRILDDGTKPPTHPLVGPRVGITKAVDVPWRFRMTPGVRAQL